MPGMASRRWQASLSCAICRISASASGPGGQRIAGIVVGFAGAESDGLRAIQPLRDLGSILMDTVSWTPYCQLQQQLDVSYPKGLRNYWKSGFLDDVNDDLINLLIESLASAPSSLDHVIIEPWGGAISRVPRDATAFDYRSTRYNLMILAVSTDPALDAENMEWARRVWNAAQRFSLGGSYLNYLGTDEDVRVAYRDEKYERLVALKRRYDPQNVFRLNQNIRP